MPERYANTFVLKVIVFNLPMIYNYFFLKVLNITQDENNIEYIIDALNPEEMRQWLATIKYCMRKRDGLHDDIRFVNQFQLRCFFFYFD